VRYVESTNTPPAAAFLEVARTLSERMKQPEQALSWLERGLSVHPNDLELRCDFAERLLRAGQHQRAVAELERVVLIDPTRESAWRQLAEGLSRLKRSSDSSVGVAPLIALGFANDLERATWSTRVARTAAALPGSFGESELLAISPRTGDDPAAALIAALGDITSKLYPPELERWNVTSRDRLGAKSGHPTRALADRLAAAFGLGDYELYLHKAHSGLVELELTDPVSLLVPVSVTSMSEPEQAFLLGRALSMAARGVAAVDRLVPPMLGVLLAAGARLVDASFGAGEYDEEYLAVQARKLARALPWLGRGPIEDAARAYAQAPLRDVSEWALAMKIAAVRAGAILADDLPSSVALVRRLEGDLSGAEGQSLIVGGRIAHDLVRFWVSEGAFVLRRRLGLG
jgi:tetratricopeptide (TPR) repeat protein